MGEAAAGKVVDGDFLLHKSGNSVDGGIFARGGEKEAFFGAWGVKILGGKKVLGAELEGGVVCPVADGFDEVEDEGGGIVLVGVEKTDVGV